MSYEKKWEVLPMLPVSWGEVFDKLTILKIKLEKITDKEKIKNISNEKNEIEKVIGDIEKFPKNLLNLINDLYEINTLLWDIENEKRAYENKKNFDEKFILLAREVYIKNDMRALLKQKINFLLKSKLIEEKSHKL